MSEESVRKVRRFLVYLAILMIAVALSYILVYPLGYSPLGYETFNTKDDLVVLQSDNVIGLEEERVTYVPQEGEEWTIGYLKDLIQQLRTQYFFFFTSVFIALLWGAFDLMRKKSWRRVLIQGCLYVFVPTVSLVTQVNKIKDVLNHAI
ncbi:hypothetical protein [Bacillus sp. RAR_GA_16]|uniref:hypothetical protein n=1 Tax=Bacillus sp. RAR_GA_16 TaxID=2876774 RepID=UPI001CCB0575|nr:hypothetical protein [Bacillus sp. RAR_GA_16]MCA0173976.1 hypothetical protein [Bacillus sp. RAR_GA_16]